MACEKSGIVRDAFRNLGHDAYSCDVLCADHWSPYHIRDDVFTHLDDGWDLIVAHPPCTYLSYAGTAWWNKPGRKEKRESAMKFFMKIYNCNVDKIAIENPLGHPNVAFRKPDQTVNPFNFGEAKRKRICLWLKGIPLLKHTDEVEPPAPHHIQANGKRRHFVDSVRIGVMRQQIRSRFFLGIARAMADQWGGKVEPCPTT